MTVNSAAVLCFTRQDLPVLTDIERVKAGVPRGAYVLIDTAGTPDVILLATGSEVSIAVDAAKLLADAGVKARVVSMPCWELFDAQDAAYHEAVLPAAVTKRVSIEAGVTLGWQKYVGSVGITLGVDHFGASAPYEVLYETYGLTAANMAAKAQSLLKA